MKHILKQQAGILHLLPALLISGLLVVVVGGAVVANKQAQGHKAATLREQQTAQAKLDASSKASTQSSAPTPTPSPVQGQAVATPTPAPVATPKPTVKPAPVANITHPTQANCNDQKFTVYASATGGTKEYYSTDTSSTVYRTVPYGQAMTVSCGSWLTAGWVLSVNSDVRFQDVSLTKP